MSLGTAKWRVAIAIWDDAEYSKKCFGGIKPGTSDLMGN